MKIIIGKIKFVRMNDDFKHLFSLSAIYELNAKRVQSDPNQATQIIAVVDQQPVTST